MNRLLLLYPRWWRQRYGEEFAALLEDLSGTRRHPRLIIDVVAGAVDAHLRSMAMRRIFTDPAVRRGVYDGLIISAVTAVMVVLTNVAFPAGPDDSDSDGEYLWQYVATLVVLVALFIAIGFRGRRGGGTLYAGARAGVAAGLVVAVMVTLTFLAVNTVFLGIVSRQHDKQVAFAASGWSSMRAYLAVTQIESLAFLLPVGALAGITLGLVGAAIAARRDATRGAATP